MIKSSGYKGFSENFANIQTHLIECISGKTFEPSSPTSSSETSADSPDANETPVSCPCESHLEKTDAEQVLPVPADLVYNILFGKFEESFWSQVDAKNNTTKRALKPWENNKRTLTFTVPINNPMVKAKELDVVSNHERLTFNENNCYVVSFKNATPNAPYGDAFNTETRFCITKISSKKCKILITNGINFTKSVLVKGIIKSSGLKGLAESASLIMETLVAHEEIKKYVPKDQVLTLAPTPAEVKKTGTFNYNVLIPVGSILVLVIAWVFGFGLFANSIDILDPNSPIIALEKGIPRKHLNNFYKATFNNTIPNSGSHLVNTELVQTHIELGREYLKTLGLKKDLDYKLGLVYGMETHLLWALYLNYEESRLLKCQEQGLDHC